MAQQPDQPDYDGLLFSTFDGLKNTVTRERLKPTELEVALNVDIDDAGQVHSRRGFTLKAAGNFHSVRDLSGVVYGVKDGVLGVIAPDYSFHTLGASVGAAPLCYTEAGGDVYFTSSMASGVIKGTTVEAWGAQVSPTEWISPVINPTATLGQVAGKLYRAPPQAEYCTYYNGRIYLAQDNVVWATELWLYKKVDANKNYLQFESKVTGLGTVTDGIYVMTESGIYFCGGTFPLKRMPLSGAAGVPGSIVALPAEVVKPQITQTEAHPSRNAVMMLTSDGIMAGFDGGEMINLTYADYLFPNAERAAAMFRKMDGVNQYVTVIDSGGTPTNTARVGDYVEVEIRRFTGA